MVVGVCLVSGSALMLIGAYERIYNERKLYSPQELNFVILWYTVPLLIMIVLLFDSIRRLWKIRIDREQEDLIDRRQMLFQFATYIVFTAAWLVNFSFVRSQPITVTSICLDFISDALLTVSLVQLATT